MEECYPATLLKLTLLHGCFPRFLNCTNSTKSRNAQDMCATSPWLISIAFLPYMLNQKHKPTDVQVIRYQ